MSIEVPEHLRTGPLAEAAARALQDAGSMASSSNSVPRMSFKGREFRLIENGEEVAKFRDKIDIIIVGVEPDAGRMIKAFYEKGYTSGSKEPPTCSSDDGIAPSPWVTSKQSPSCAGCPKNQFGSATSPGSGKPTKACRDSKRIWFKVADGNTIPDGKGGQMPYELPPFGDRTLYGANITVASLRAFAEHGRALAALGQGPAVAVTRMLMVDAEFPQQSFLIQAWLDAQTAPLSLEMAEKRPWKIQYKNAGLALASGDGASRGNANALPGSVPNVPTHLQKTSPIDGQVADAVEVVNQAAKPGTDARTIDDAVGGW